MKALIVFFILLWDVSSFAAETCHLPGYQEPLQCLTVAVPQDYSKGETKLQLHVTVAKAYRETAKLDPMFVLAGGPGQAGSSIVRLLDVAFRKLRATRDIVFLDQRGTGFSGKLTCERLQQADDVSETEQDKLLKECLTMLRKPYEHYNTANAARDIDEVRKALGYEVINIWGGSYGTRLAQVYQNMFPKNVRAMILDGVAAPDQILGAWGADAQAALDAMFARCSREKTCSHVFPELREQFYALLLRVRAANVPLTFQHPRTGKIIQSELTSRMFVENVRIALYSPDFTARLPYVIQQAHQNNWLPFVSLMYTNSDWSTDAMAIGLTLSVICAEDMPKLTQKTIEEEKTNSFLSGLQVTVWPRWCEYLNVPSALPSPPAQIDAPVLLLSGALDPVTPPHCAERAAEFMRNANHLVAPNAGHGVSNLGCAPSLMRQFIDEPRKKLEGECLRKIPSPPFMTSIAGMEP